jgi:hypothetical protein
MWPNTSRKTEISELIQNDHHQTFHELIDNVGISNRVLPGDLSRRLEHVWHCHEVCSLTLDKDQKWQRLNMYL